MSIYYVPAIVLSVDMYKLVAASQFSLADTVIIPVFQMEILRYRELMALT